MRVGRLVVLCLLCVVLAGCTSATQSVGSPLNLKDRKLAKQVESDPFPSADEVNLATP